MVLVCGTATKAEKSSLIKLKRAVKKKKLPAGFERMSLGSNKNLFQVAFFRETWYNNLLFNQDTSHVSGLHSLSCIAILL